MSLLLLLQSSGPAPPVVGKTLFCVHGPELFAGGAVVAEAVAGGADLAEARVGGADVAQAIRGEDRR